MTVTFKIVLVATVGILTCQVLAQQKSKEMSECQTQLKVTDDDVKNYMDKNVTLPFKMKCFIKCIGEKFGIYANGKLDVNKVMSQIKESAKNNTELYRKEMKILDACKSVTGKNNDACETAGAIYSCVRNEAMKTNWQ